MKTHPVQIGIEYYELTLSQMEMLFTENALHIFRKVRRQGGTVKFNLGSFKPE